MHCCCKTHTGETRCDAFALAASAEEKNPRGVVNSETKLANFNRSMSIKSGDFSPGSELLHPLKKLKRVGLFPVKLRELNLEFWAYFAQVRLKSVLIFKV